MHQYEFLAYQLKIRWFFFLSDFFLRKSRASSYWNRSACYITPSSSLPRPTFWAILHRILLSRSWESEERRNGRLEFQVYLYTPCRFLYSTSPEFCWKSDGAFTLTYKWKKLPQEIRYSGLITYAIVPFLCEQEEVFLEVASSKLIPWRLTLVNLNVQGLWRL